jgi:GH3 auxin-responsive promoter
MAAAPVLELLAGNGLARRAVDALFATYAARRVRQLDRRPAASVQSDALLRLVRRARPTRFGRDHGFDAVRTVADYQRRVPLRTYEQFWHDYWQPAFPRLDDVTWPGRIPYFALSSGTTAGSTKYVPVSREMVASNRKAALTALALFRAAHPGPLFTGRLFFLGGSTDLQEMRNDERGTMNEISSVRHSSFIIHRSSFPLAGDLSGIAAREVSPLLRPYTFPPLELALLRDWERKVQLLAEQAARLPVTVVGGVPSWLLLLFERLLQVTGRRCIAEVWPALRVVVHGGTKFDPYREVFRRALGSDAVRCLEVYPASEGFVAAEDPRHDLLRLVPDHGVFFEFVPVEDLGKGRPARHTAADLEPGVQYAVALTTCAGLWGYVLGDTVCFEKREPPLLRFTGRTKYFLSAFGEHLISEEVERAVAEAAAATGAAVVDFHVGPVFPAAAGQTGRHRYLVEFAQPPADVDGFAAELDAALGRLNEDYAAHRAGDLTMLAPEVWPVPRGGFAGWLRVQGKLGGQHKLPRMDNSGQLTQELSRWAQESRLRLSVP